MSVYLTKEMIAPATHRNSATRPDGPIGRLIIGAKQHWQRRKMAIALQELDDRILADIGLHRGDIPGLVASLSPSELRMAPVARDRFAKTAQNDTILQGA